MAASGIRLFTKKLFKEYTKEFGERKARALLQNISDSTLLSKTLQLWDEQNYVPTYQDFQKVVGAINWFVFSKRETTAVGMIMALSLWDERINRPKNLISELAVMQLAFNTLNWLKVYLREVELWQQEFTTQLLSQKAEGISLVENTIKGCRISNIQQISYNIVSGNILRNKKILSSDISIYAEIGAPIKGSIFTELPDIIINSISPSGYDSDDNFYHCEPENLELIVTDKFLTTDTEVKIEICTPDTFYQRDSKGKMVTISVPSRVLECDIDKNGIYIVCKELSWMFLLGGNVNEWIFSEYTL